MAEILIHMDRDQALVRVMFDGCTDSENEDGIEVPVHSGKVCKRLFCLDAGPKRVMFLPGGPGAISFESIRFKWVGARFAESRMLRRLAAKDPVLLGLEAREIRKRLLQDKNTEPYIEALSRRYGETFPSDSSSARYDLWIRRVEKPEWEDPALVQERVERMTSGPLISILLPVYESDERWLCRCIESVQKQYYSNWELCVADDGSHSPHVKRILEEYSALDSRIKVTYRERNGHICQATNTAFVLSSGAYVAFLDHDDELAPHALLCVVEELTAHVDTRLLYSDEDFLDESGVRKNPHFKPDFNPDLLLSHNYITHLCVVDRKLFEDVGGLRPGFEGSQDYDFLLRCVSRVDSSQVRHIAKILYHWRAVQGSTALDAGAKAYSVKAGKRALEEYLLGEGIAGSVELGRIANTYRVVYPVPGSPLVSVIVPTKDCVSFLSRCVQSVLEKSTYREFELLIVDNGSKDPETLQFLEQIEKHAQIRVLRYPHPFNYAAINNFAVGQAEGEVVCLLNNDVEVISGEWMNEMVSHAVRSGVGCVGAKLYYGNRQIQHGGIVLGLGGYAAHSHRLLSGGSHGYFGRLTMVQNYCAVTGACLMVKKSKYFEVGGLDEELFAVGYNDVDFGLKLMKKGFYNVWTPYAELYHYESISRGADDVGEKKIRFEQEKKNLHQKWKTFIEHDPCYNVNLTRSAENFAIRN